MKVDDARRVAIQEALLAADDLLERCDELQCGGRSL